MTSHSILLAGLTDAVTPAMWLALIAIAIVIGFFGMIILLKSNYKRCNTSHVACTHRNCDSHRIFRHDYLAEKQLQAL